MERDIEQRDKILQATLKRIDKEVGKGAVIILGDSPISPVPTIPTGSLSLDVALGVGGMPRGRIVEAYGPPGCGKTYLARATAGEVRAGFLSVGLNDVLDMWIGNSERQTHVPLLEGMVIRQRILVLCATLQYDLVLLGRRDRILRYAQQHRRIRFDADDEDPDYGTGCAAFFGSVAYA